MRKKKKILLLIIVVLAVPFALLAVLFALLQSPRAVNALAARFQPLTGIVLHVDDISVNRHLEAKVSGLRLREVKEKGLDIILAQADLRADVGAGLKVEVEKILLTGPSFTFHLQKKSETDPFAVLKKLPPVRLLEVTDGRLELKSEEAVYSLPGLEVTIRDFEPEGGGKLNGRGRFDVRSRGLAARGSLETNLSVSRFSPRPSGSGSARLSLDAGSFGGVSLADLTFSTGLTLSGDVLSLTGTQAALGSLSRGEGAEKITARNLKARFSGSYDQKTSAFALPSVEASGAGVGSLKGRASGTVKPPSWNASLRASSVDLAQVFGLVRPLLPPDYRSWTFKGSGGLDVESEGRTAGGATAWKASAVVNLKQGGFASPDSSKAGERITGRIELKLGTPEKGRQGAFAMALEGSGGELLWGTYYQDFKGEKIKVMSRGAFDRNPFSLSSSGTLDLFRTGDYAFSAEWKPDHSVFSLDARDVSCPRLYRLVLQNYVVQNYPGWQDLALEGETDLKLTATLSPQQKTVEGDFSLRGGAVDSPSNRLVLTGLNITLPYDLALAGKPLPASSGEARQGSLSFARFEKGEIRVGSLETPVVLSGNRFILPEPVGLTLFGGEVRLAGLRAENLLRPDLQVETGLAVRRLDLETLIGQASPWPLPGRIDGDLPSIVFREGQWSAEGGLVVQLFEGRVNLTNLTAGRVFSPSRFFGVNAAFEQINLEAVTANIKMGRMTGLIKGSLTDFLMEYGQPARFDLVITSDRSRKAPQEISVDAIKNIQLISTGSGAISDILGSGLNQFFKEYPYRAIGIRCSLAEDVFSLRGLIHAGGKEYLVRRGWLRGIDIINQNPDNAISYKDMAERVGRVFQTREESRTAPSG